MVIIMPILLLIASTFIFNTPGCKRQRKSWQSNAFGLKRHIVWSGFNGTNREWNVTTKVFTDENNVTFRFFDEKGHVVIIGPGILIEEE